MNLERPKLHILAKALLLLNFFCGPVKSLGGTITAVTPATNPPSTRDTGCEGAVLSNYRLEVSRWIGAKLESEDVKSEDLKLDGQEVAADIKSRIIQSWIKERHHSLDQATYLDDVDAHLDPSRASYYSYEDDEGRLNGVRLVDGSVIPMFYGLQWSDNYSPQAELPFEPDLEKQGYVLPERRRERLQGKPAYVLSLGLLNVDRFYAKGVEALYRYVAHFFVDRNYNGFNYRSKKDLSVISSLDVQIYIVCRETHVKIHEAKGFKRVYYDESGREVKTSDHLNLMKMSAADFIERYFAGPAIPHPRKEEDRWDYQEEEERHVRLQEKFARVKSKVFDFNREDVRIRQTFKLSQLKLMVENMEFPLANNPIGGLMQALGLMSQIEKQFYDSIYAQFFEALYIYMHSVYEALSPDDLGEQQYPEQFLKPFEVLMSSDNPRNAYSVYLQMVEHNLTLGLWDQSEMKQIMLEYPHYLIDLDKEIGLK